jgi:uncharacterized membrane protein
MLKAFFLILILASGLRFTALTFDGLWLDEGYQTVVESYGNNLPNFLNSSGQAFVYKSDNPASIKDVLTNFRKVDPLCPPLFAVLMNRWITTFGGSDLSLRLFPAFCSIFSVIAIYFFGTILLGKNSGLYAALLQAISPFDICYAQEARMYSLCTLLAVISGGSLLYLCLKKESSKHILFAILYAISTWALINTHYTQIFLWAFAIFIGFVVAILRKDWRLLSLIVISNLAIILLSLPWLSLFLQAASLRTASFYVTRQPSLWWPIWALVIRIPFNWLIFLSGKKVMVWAIPIFVTSLIIMGQSLLFLSSRIKQIYTKQNNKILATAIALKNPITLLFLWSVIPAFMIWVLDVKESHRVVEIPRYLISTMPSIFLLAGFSLTLQRSKAYFIPLVLCHTLFCLANNAYLHIIPQKEDWRKIAQLVEKNCSTSEILFVSNYYNIVCLDRYLQKPFRQIGISAATGAPIIENKIIQERTDLNPAPNFWILSAQEGDTVFHTIPAHFKVLQQYDLLHALHLRKYQYSNLN